MKNDDKMMRNDGKRWKMMTLEVFEVYYYILIKENIISFHFKKVFQDTIGTQSPMNIFSYSFFL